MTEQQLAELEALANAATPGPWQPQDDIGYGRGIETLAYNEDVGVLFGEADAAFIASARTAVPKLIAEVRRLRKLLERCRPYMDHWHNCWPRFGCLCSCGLDDVMSEAGVSDD